MDEPYDDLREDDVDGFDRMGHGSALEEEDLSGFVAAAEESFSDILLPSIASIDRSSKSMRFKEYVYRYSAVLQCLCRLMQHVWECVQESNPCQIIAPVYGLFLKDGRGIYIIVFFKTILDMQIN
jgi:hypothetical protein